MTTEQLKKRIAALLPHNEELAKYKTYRERDKNRKYIPGYHFSSPGGYLNDPCGFCFYKGVYHLFYQFVPEDTGLLGWGHAVSVDQIEWIDLPAAVMPTVETACGSGGTLVEEDRVILGFQGDMKDKLGGAIHVMVSSDELLLRWERIGNTPAITTYDENGNRNPYNAFDPCFFKEDGVYYLLSAGGGSLPHPDGLENPDYRQFYLFSSEDLVNWEYRYPLIDHDRFSDLGDDGACPYFLPIGEDKRLLVHFSHRSGGKYIIGRYDKETQKFTPERGGSFNRNSWLSGVHAPSAFTDENGEVRCIFNMNYGWIDGPVNQIMSLPRVLSLGENGQLAERPCGGFESLRYGDVSAENVTIPANREVVLDGVEGNMLEIILTLDKAAPEKRNAIFMPDNLLPVFEIRVMRSPDLSEYSSVRVYRNRSRMNWAAFRKGSVRWANAAASVLEIDTSSSTVSADVAVHPVESQEFYVEPDQPIRLHIFVDKSVIEAFAGDQRCAAVRAYPALEESTGVSVISRGADAVISYEIWKMKQIF